MGDNKGREIGYNLKKYNIFFRILIKKKLVKISSEFRTKRTLE